jgi:hypothetical protein
MNTGAKASRARKTQAGGYSRRPSVSRGGALSHEGGEMVQVSVG